MKNFLLQNFTVYAKESVVKSMLTELSNILCCRIHIHYWQRLWKMS